jgi:probable DNA repair protein
MFAAEILALPAATTLVLSPSDRARRAFAVCWARESMRAHARDATLIPTFATVKSFFASLWDEAQLFGTLNDSRVRLDPAIESSLWRSIAVDVASTSAAESAVLAERLAEAWALEHQYRQPSESESSSAKYVPVATGASGELYREARSRFASLLKSSNTITSSELATAIANRPTSFDFLKYKHCVLTPAFASANDEKILLARINEYQSNPNINWNKSSEVRLRKVRVLDRRSERRAAIEWARARLLPESNGESITGRGQIAIVVPDLATSRGEWERALIESGLSHNLSLGLPVSKYPWAAVGFTLVSALFSAMAPETIAQALRHRRWGRSDSTFHAIGRRERSLLERGVAEITLLDFCRADIGFQDEALRPLETALHEQARLFHSSRTVLARADWKIAFERTISALTENPSSLDTFTFQLRQALQTAIDRWCELDNFLPRVTALRAQQELIAMTDQSPFQPEGSDAPLQVIGLLESAGVPFDAMWVAGLSDRVLPEAQRLNPFLAVSWQKEQRAGLASIEECEARATRLLAGWQQLCGDITASLPQAVDDEPQIWSPLVTAWPDANAIVAPNQMVKREAPQPIVTDDERAPPWLAPRSRGVRALEAQAECPRRGFAEGRLRLSAWPTPSNGLSAQTRGTMIHDIAEALGRQLMRTPMAFDALGEALPNVVSDTINAAATTLPHVPTHIWNAERGRLQTIFEKFIAAEAARPPFSVIDVERALRAKLGSLDFSLRVDRIDETHRALSESGETLASSLAVIDFKSGTVQAKRLYDERLTAPQLPLYAFALSQAAQGEASRESVDAIAYARIHDDQQAFVSFGAETSGLARKSRKGIPTWDEMRSAWLPKLELLAAELVRGEAALAPAYGRNSCNQCHFQRFCRVDVSQLSEFEAVEEGDDADMGAVTAKGASPA